MNCIVLLLLYIYIIYYSPTYWILDFKQLLLILLYIYIYIYIYIILLYGVLLSMYLLCFGMGNMLANFHMCGIMLVLRAIQEIGN